jgi:hypothetical protein
MFDCICIFEPGTDLNRVDLQPDREIPICIRVISMRMFASDVAQVDSNYAAELRISGEGIPLLQAEKAKGGADGAAKSFVVVAKL